MMNGVIVFLSPRLPPHSFIIAQVLAIHLHHHVAHHDQSSFLLLACLSHATPACAIRGAISSPYTTATPVSGSTKSSGIAEPARQQYGLPTAPLLLYNRAACIRQGRTTAQRQHHLRDFLQYPNSAFTSTTTRVPQILLPLWQSHRPDSPADGPRHRHSTKTRHSASLWLQKNNPFDRKHRDALAR
jgi:hypothetical protein